MLFPSVTLGSGPRLGGGVTFPVRCTDFHSLFLLQGDRAIMEVEGKVKMRCDCGDRIPDVSTTCGCETRREM